MTPAAPDVKNVVTVGGGEKPGVVSQLDVGKTQIDVKVISADGSNEQVLESALRRKLCYARFGL